jgi:hypothetical protein
MTTQMFAMTLLDWNVQTPWTVQPYEAKDARIRRCVIQGGGFHAFAPFASCVPPAS